MVSFQTPNWVETAVIDLAAAMAGFVINPIVIIYRDAEVRQMLGDCRAKAFFFAETFRGFDFAAMIVRLRPDLPALAHAIPVRGQGPGYADLIAAGRGGRLSVPRVDPASVKLVLYTSAGRKACCTVTRRWPAPSLPAPPIGVSPRVIRC